MQAPQRQEARLRQALLLRRALHLSTGQVEPARWEPRLRQAPQEEEPLLWAAPAEQEVPLLQQALLQWPLALVWLVPALHQVRSLRQAVLVRQAASLEQALELPLVPRQPQLQ